MSPNLRSVVLYVDNTHNITHISQGFFFDTEAIARLPQFQWITPINM